MDKYKTSLIGLITMLAGALKKEYLDNERIKEHLENLNELLEKYEENEKALDKACWCIVNNISFLSNTTKKENEWAEWFKEEWY